ncbi:MAG: DUF1186 domain-containing protein [Haliscomenobacter sp.]|nr:DUF1186 domain-containing protein [Haliscomenobacter sp.]MDX2071650.1 DUF1186 domain-containing protein [Haliscomenobacter sp.]
MSLNLPLGLTPNFNHPIVEKLYDVHFIPPRNLLEELLALPGATLIEDLEWIIRDELDYVQSLDEEDEEEENYTLFHTLMILGHLRSEKSLPLILEVWRLEPDTIDLVFGDLLYEDLWQVLWLCGEHQVPLLKNFILDDTVPGVFCRTEMVDTFDQIVINAPSRRQEILQVLAELLRHFDQIPDEKFSEDHCIICSNLASSISDLNATEYLPFIASLFERDRIDLNLRGDWFEFQKDFGNPYDLGKKVYLDIRDWYADRGRYWLDVMQNNTLEEERRQLERLQKLREKTQAQQTNKNKKIGRNDPCPCGSGKKYKKCHGMH